MKRLIDIIFCILLFFPISIILIVIFPIVKFESRGPYLHWSKRIGKKNKTFLMPKIRTMKVNTPDVATHLLRDSDNYVTKFGKILRKYSIDELPQIYSVFFGDMSFVGPRPALFNQYDLIDLRSKKGIQEFLPGITGWAQINGRDNLKIIEKIELDYYYTLNSGIFFDFYIIYKTVKACFVTKNKNVSH